MKAELLNFRQDVIAYKKLRQMNTRRQINDTTG